MENGYIPIRENKLMNHGILPLSNILFDRIHTPNLIHAWYPGSRNLLVFNNGLKAKKSSVYEFRIPEELAIENIDKSHLIWSFSDDSLSYGRISGAYRLSKETL